MMTCIQLYTNFKEKTSTAIMEQTNTMSGARFRFRVVLDEHGHFKTYPIGLA